MSGELTRCAGSLYNFGKLFAARVRYQNKKLDTSLATGRAGESEKGWDMIFIRLAYQSKQQSQPVMNSSRSAIRQGELPLPLPSPSVRSR